MSVLNASTGSSIKWSKDAGSVAYYVRERLRTQLRAASTVR